MLLLAGEHEVLFDDSRRVHENALAAGVASTLHVGATHAARLAAHAALARGEPRYLVFDRRVSLETSCADRTSSPLPRGHVHARTGILSGEVVVIAMRSRRYE